MMDVATFYEVLRDVNISRTQTLVQDYLQKDIPASQILNDGLIGAMNIIGREFKAKEVWVPDVLLADLAGKLLNVTDKFVTQQYLDIS